MIFLDELGKKITQTSQGVVQKTKDTAETIKLNGWISDEEKRITNFYNKIGKKYFELHVDSYEPTFEQMIVGIKEAQAKIESYSEQIKRLKGYDRCPNCGKEVPYGVSFCSACGAKINVVLNTTVLVENNNVLRCANCGDSLALGTVFCANCGTKVEGALATSVLNTAASNSSVVEAPVNTSAHTTKLCTICGKEIAATAKFCIGCGAHIGD